LKKVNIFVLSLCLSVLFGQSPGTLFFDLVRLKVLGVEHATASSQGAGGLRILAEYFVPSGTVDIGSEC